MERRDAHSATVAGELLMCMDLKYYLSFRETPGGGLYGEFRNKCLYLMRDDVHPRYLFIGSHLISCAV